MNNILKKAIEVKKLLHETKEYQDYKLLKESANKNNLFEIDNKLKEMQKELTISLDNGEMEKHFALAKVYKKEQKEFIEEPLYQNYLESKETLNDLIKQLLDILCF